jgi:hypothetical protein
MARPRVADGGTASTNILNMRSRELEGRESCVRKGRNGRESLRRLKPTVGCNASRRRRRKRRRRSHGLPTRGWSSSLGVGRGAKNVIMLRHRQKSLGVGLMLWYNLSSSSGGAVVNAVMNLRVS